MTNQGVFAYNVIVLFCTKDSGLEITMELIMINSEKMKIMLTREDMTYYDIKMYSLGHTGNAVRKAFSRVLEDIKSETGFDTVTAKSILQVYPSRDGGCEVYVTRLGNKGDETVPTDNTRGGRDGARVSVKKWLDNVIFVFEDITDTIDACRLLLSDGYAYNSRLYEDSGRYYLFLEDDTCGINLTGELCRLADFGKKIGGKITEAYIYEHCKLIIPERAVEKLGR